MSLLFAVADLGVRPDPGYDVESTEAQVCLVNNSFPTWLDGLFANYTKTLVSACPIVTISVMDNSSR